MQPPGAYTTTIHKGNGLGADRNMLAVFGGGKTLFVPERPGVGTTPQLALKCCQPCVLATCSGPHVTALPYCKQPSFVTERFVYTAGILIALNPVTITHRRSVSPGS